MQAALHMQNALLGFNSLQRKDGLPELMTGIGLNSGMTVAGNIGVAQRSEYTLLGDAVNTASRIEHAAGKDQVLISGATLGELKGAGIGIRMPPLKVKNKAEPLQVISLRGLVVGDEIIMHLPILISDHPVFVLRRLSDKSFVVLHPKDCDITGGIAHTAIPEWLGIALGRPKMITVLPTQLADGTLMRSQVSFEDPGLGGLLAGTEIVCPVGWEHLVR